MKQAKYSEEFRREAIRLVEQEKRGEAEVARDLGIGRSTLSHWRRKYGSRRAEAGGSVKETAEQKVARLQKQVRVLEMEREILKKAATFFAKEGM